MIIIILKLIQTFQIQDGFLAVGSWSSYNKKAELYSFDTGTWITADDYPFGSGSGLADYAMLYIPETSSYLVIGGMASGSQIAEFKDGAWYDAGRLNSVRGVSFRSFLVVSKFLIKLQVTSLRVVRKRSCRGGWNDTRKRRTID